MQTTNITTKIRSEGAFSGASLASPGRGPQTQAQYIGR
jgi:hypothetical protein